MGYNAANTFVLGVLPRPDELHGHIVHNTGEVDVDEEALKVVQCMCLMKQRVKYIALFRKRVQMRAANMRTLINTKKFISFSREYRMMKS